MRSKKEEMKLVAQLLEKYTPEFADITKLVGPHAVWVMISSLLATIAMELDMPSDEFRLQLNHICNSYEQTRIAISHASSEIQ